MIKQKVKPNDVIVTAKYLNSKRIGNLEIMITRTEISDNVKRDLVRIWKEENKFILLISDKDLIDMITLKEDDNEPEKIIEKLIFDFRRSLDLFKNISFFCFTQNYLGKIQNKQGIP